jgi:hypothetical protein
MDRSRLEAVAQYTVPPARGRITGYRIGDEQSAGIETALLPIIAVGARAKGGNGRVFELGKFDKSGRDSVAATLKLLQSARHCKYDRNENKRGHISHQMTASAGSLRA